MYGLAPTLIMPSIRGIMTSDEGGIPQKVACRVWLPQVLGLKAWKRRSWSCNSEAF